MISLDQVRILEKKVESAVKMIVDLRKENTELKNKCVYLEKMNTELNSKVSVFEQEQNRVEEGLLSVLNRLDVVEDAVSTSSAQADNSDNVMPTVPEVDISLHNADSFAPVEEVKEESGAVETPSDGFSPNISENGQFDIF